jgi:hypothetical protein
MPALSRQGDHRRPFQAGAVGYRGQDGLALGRVNPVFKCCQGIGGYKTAPAVMPPKVSVKAALEAVGGPLYTVMI